MNVVENFNIFKEGPLFAPVWYATQFYPFLSYFMKKTFVGLGTGKAEDFNKSCVSRLINIPLNCRTQQAVRLFDDPYIQGSTEWI